MHAWLCAQVFRIWALREDIVKAFFLTVFSGGVLKFLVEVCGIAPTPSFIVRWVIVTITGFYVYRYGVDHDGRTVRQVSRYSLRRVRKGTLSLLAYTGLVAAGMHYFTAWLACATVLGLYELSLSKKSLYGERPRS